MAYTQLDEHPRPTNVDELKRLGRSWFPHHPCAICGYWIGFHVQQNGAVTLNASCECTKIPDVRPSSWIKIMEHYNSQRSDVAIRHLAETWGLPDPFPADNGGQQR